jgi:putative two-component system response regulator
MEPNRSNQTGNVQVQGAPWSTAALEIGTRPNIVIVSADLDAAHRVAALLRESDYTVTIAYDRPAALRQIVWHLPALVILDLHLSGDDGITLCASLKNDRRTNHIPIIIISNAYNCQEHVCCIETGADDYVDASTSCRILEARVSALLRARRSAEQEQLDRIVQTLGRTAQAKDHMTGAHLQRLGVYAMHVGRRLGLEGPELETLRHGALLHDIGKIGVPDAILHKPDLLTEEEYRTIQQHTVVGELMIAPLALPASVVAIVRHHHERWDGHGYPDGLVGEAIPLGARIVAVVDAFDAMTIQRPYSQQLTCEAAIDCLHTGAGSQWDPKVVVALIDYLAEYAPCRERAVGEATAPQDLLAPRPAVTQWLATA